MIHLLYLSIGSGHQMAARAVEEAIRRLAGGVELDVYDPLARKMPFFPALAQVGLGWAMRYGGRLYQMRWQTGDARWVSWAARRPWLMRGMATGDRVVATHAFALRMALAQRAREGTQGKVYGVVTDFGLHGYWPLEEVDGYFVGNEELRAVLAERGYPAERVAVSGIPLRLDFATGEAWQPRRAGGPLRVLILAGGVSSGAYLFDVAWFEALLRALAVSPRAVRFTVVAGSRQKLLAGLQGLARQTRFEVYPRGLVGDMAGVMRAHDLLLAKPGGVTVAEALACGLPLAALHPGPGQETANGDFLRRKGVWLEAFSPAQAAEVIRKAVEEEDWLYTAGQRCRALGRPEAALDVARAVLEGLE